MVNGAGTRVDPNNPYLYKYTFTGTFVLPTTADPTDPANTIQIDFLPGTFRDSAGANEPGGDAAIHPLRPGAPVRRRRLPVAQLASPFNGATISTASLLTRPYIDVTFAGVGAGGTVTSAVDGDEIKLSGPGAANLQLNNGFIVFPAGQPGPELLFGTTYRYYVKAKSTSPTRTCCSSTAR